MAEKIASERSDFFDLVLSLAKDMPSLMKDMLLRNMIYSASRNVFIVFNRSLIRYGLIKRKRQSIGTIVPEAVKAIESAVIPMEKMYDNMTVIQNNPAAFTAAFTPAEIDAFTGHKLINSIRKRGYLTGSTAGSNHHMITEHSQAGYIQSDDVLGFTVIEKTGNTEYGFLILHDLSSKNNLFVTAGCGDLFFHSRKAAQPADRIGCTRIKIPAF